MFPISQPAPKVKKTRRWWLRLAAWVCGITFAMTLLANFAVRGYASRHGGTEGVQAMAKMKILEARLYTYKLLHGVYPTEQEGLEIILKTNSPSGDAEHVAEYLRDPWHRRFQYRCPGVHNLKSYDLSSFGPDGIEGTEDDLTNW
jgi:general secretion pathway protein G